MKRQDLQKLRQEALDTFDKLWINSKKPRKARGGAYYWLGKNLGMWARQINITRLNEEQCRKVITICRDKTEKDINVYHALRRFVEL